MGKTPSNPRTLTWRQRRAIPLLVGAKTIEAGCKASGISRQTFFNWLKREDFREEYKRQRDNLFNLAYQTMRL